jgi:hypothetical protein
VAWGSRVRDFWVGPFNLNSIHVLLIAVLPAMEHRMTCVDRRLSAIWQADMELSSFRSCHTQSTDSANSVPLFLCSSVCLSLADLSWKRIELSDSAILSSSGA